MARAKTALKGREVRARANEARWAKGGNSWHGRQVAGASSLCVSSGEEHRGCRLSFFWPLAHHRHASRAAGVSGTIPASIKNGHIPRKPHIYLHDALRI
jgi:hypothetical protein